MSRHLAARAVARRRMSHAKTRRAEPIFGKAAAEKILQGVRADVHAMRESYAYVPGLAVITVGDFEESIDEVNDKHDQADMLGMRSIEAALPANVSADDVFMCINKFNADPTIDGIIIQLPVPGKSVSFCLMLRRTKSRSCLA